MKHLMRGNSQRCDWPRGIQAHLPMMKHPISPTTAPIQTRRDPSGSLNMAPAARLMTEAGTGSTAAFTSSDEYMRNGEVLAVKHAREVRGCDHVLCLLQQVTCEKSIQTHKGYRTGHFVIFDPVQDVPNVVLDT